MSAYDDETLYDVAFREAEKAVRRGADSGISYAGDPNLRHAIAEWVASSWRSVVDGGDFRNFGALSSNLEIRRAPDLVQAACTAVAEEFRAMGVTEENLPW